MLHQRAHAGLRHDAEVGVRLLRLMFGVYRIHHELGGVIAIEHSAIRQFHGNVSCLADRHLRVGDGASGIGVLHFDGQRPAVAVRVLIARRGLAVLVGLTAAGGNSELTDLIGLTGGVVIILVCNGNAHARYSALVLDQLHGDGGLVCVVQQAAIGQADGDRIILVECHGGVCYGVLGVGIGDGHKVAAHNGLTLTVRGGAVVDLFNGLCLQLFATHGTFFVLAALRVGGRLLVNDPVAGLMTGRLGVVALAAVSTAGTGVSGITHLRAGGSSHFGLVIMSQSLFQHSAAAGAEPGFRAGSRSAGDVAIRGVGIQTVVATAGAAVFHNPLAGAGGVGDKGALVPAVAQGFRIVRDKRTAAAIAKRVGVDEYYSEVLPEDKANFITKETEKGRKVMMIGDGINDSPALSAASVGIAVSDGAEIAKEIADITISAESLYEVVALKKISNALLKRIHKNYRSIVGINSGLIVLGVAGVLAPATSALCHNVSTLLISLNSMKNLLPEE